MNNTKLVQWDYISFSYAAFLAISGVMGYVKKSSVPSLAAGLGFGGLAAYGAYLASKDPNNVFLVGGVALIVAGMMGYRYYHSEKFFPAGVTCIASLAIVARFGARYLANK